MKLPFWLGPSFLYAPDGGSSASSAEAALEHVFGGLEKVRPDLAASEQRFTDDKKEGKPIKVGPESGRPEIETERKPEPSDKEQPPEKKSEEKPTPARKDAPPEEGESEGDGSDRESPDDEESALASLVEKYQGNPKSMAKAIRGLRSIQTRTAEDRNALLARLEKIGNVVDRDYEEVNGELRLKPEVAARHLAAQRKPGPGPLSPPDPKAIRAQVEQEIRAKATELFDGEDVPKFMATMKDHIERVTQDRAEKAMIQFEASKFDLVKNVGAIVDRHLRDYPSDKDLLTDIDAVYAGIPEELRVQAILDEWLPFSTVAELVRIKKNLQPMLKEAFQLGKKATSVVPADGGAPGGSRQRKAPSRGGGADAERAFKDRLLGGSGLPSLDSIIAPR